MHSAVLESDVFETKLWPCTALFKISKFCSENIYMYQSIIIIIIIID